VSRVLRTGMPGTGQPPIMRERRRQGVTAIDRDDPGWSTWGPDGHQRWLEAPRQTALDAAHSGPVCVSGCAEHQVTLYPQFRQIVLLSAPPDLMQNRLAGRESHAYGTRPAELARMLEHLARRAPFLRQSATPAMDTTAPVEQLVATLMARARSPVRPHHACTPTPLRGAGSFRR
jgi:hypothetical protein